MTDLITLTIDDKTFQVPKGTLIVDAAKRVENDIPVFCYHPKLPQVGMCRMCLVEVGRVQRDRATGQVVMDGDKPKIAFAPKLETACTVPVEEGMHVRTLNSKVEDARKDVVEFLLTSHPLDCPICDKGGECPLQNLTMRHGPGTSRFIYGEKLHSEKHVPLGTEDNALIYLDRERCIQCARCTRFSDEVAGDHVIGFYERGRKIEIVTFSDPGFDSKFSGNTTDICPVGALTTKDFRFGARPWELINSASICPHCPVGCNLHVNTRRTGASGKFEVKRIMPRQNELVNEIWICDKGRFGHHFAASPDRLTTPLIKKNGQLVEASWDEALDLVASKLKAAGSSVYGLAGGRLSNEDFYEFRKLFNGNAALYSRMGGGDLIQKVGIGAGSNFSAMGRGTTIVVVASDLEEEAPIWWLRVKQASERGANLIMVNARSTKIDKYAKKKITYKYGDEVNAVDGLTDAVKGSENLVVMYGSDGLDLGASKALAQACANLLINTRHTGKVNNGLIAVWQHANDQGAWDMGVRPTTEPIPERALLWIAGADLVGDGETLPYADFTVVSELFLTATAKAADVVLPAQSFLEREGTFTNGERRVQRYYRAVPPLGQGKADWQIFASVGEKCGQGKVKASPSLVMNEIARSVNHYAGITYQALAKVEKQFPDVGGIDLYYGGNAFENTTGLGVQYPSATDRGEGVVAASPESKPEKLNGMIAVPVTLLYDHGTTFARSFLMHPRVPQAFAEINSADAAKLGIKDGETITLAMNGDEAKVMAHVNGRAPEGVVLVPQSLGVNLNRVSGVTIKK
ncbi:MAG: NADH-quinone oxidoreductase subunit NuoG [Chloroflexi bacterium]|nr:NADH-quinone oxidoreductase subunit NuoG [Chloroflexota bacterium]